MKPSDALTAATAAQFPLQRRQLAAALAGLAPGALFAGVPGEDEPPLPQPPRAISLPPFSEQRLRSGVGLVVAPRHDTPLVTAVLLVRAGPESEPQGQAGVAAMTAALLTKGALREGVGRGATAIARQAEALGGSLDSGSGWRSTTLSMTVVPQRLDEALALMADCLRRPLLSGPELERSRKQSLDGLRLSLGDPAEVARLAMRRLFWGDTPFGRLASPAAFKRMVRGQLMAFHARQLRPERSVLVLAGAVDADRAARLAQRHFGDWRATAEVSATPPLQPPRPLAPPLLLIDMPGSGQSAVVVAAPFAAEADPDRRVGLVANAVLGGGYSARLNQEVRIKRGLSYGAFSDAESHSTGGMVSAQTQTNHPTAAEVLQLLRGEMLALADGPPSAAELAARHATLVGGFARRMDSTAGLAGLVLGMVVQGRPLSLLNSYVSDILAVTPEQVREFARTHWQPPALRAVIAGDLAAMGDSLKPFEATAMRLSLTELDLEQLGR